MFARRIRVALRFAGALALCAAVHPAPVRASDNLLVNPGFEDPLPGHPWMPAGWDTSQTDLPTSYFGRDTVLRHSGRYAVSTASASALIPLAHNWSQTLMADSSWWGKDAVFSVWTKSVGLEGRGYVLLQCYRDTVSRMARTWGIPREDAMRRMKIAPVDDPILDLGWRRDFFEEPESDWVHREVRVFVPPSTDMIYVRAGLYGLGQLFIDDASLTLEPAQPPVEWPTGKNLLADADFEGDLHAWELSLPPFSGIQYGQASDTASSGAHSYRFEGGSSMVRGKMGICQVLPDRALAGKRLRLSGDIKTDSLVSLAGMKLYCHTLHGAKAATSVERPSGTMPWTHTTVEIDAPPDTYEVWAWFSYMGPAPGVVWFDNASLEILGPAKDDERASKR